MEKTESKFSYQSIDFIAGMIGLIAILLMAYFTAGLIFAGYIFGFMVVMAALLHIYIESKGFKLKIEWNETNRKIFKIGIYGGILIGFAIGVFIHIAQLIYIFGI